MSLSVKLLTLFGVAGTGTAVGVPLALSNSSNTKNNHFEGGDVRRNVSNSFSLVTCGKDVRKSFEEINYGKGGLQDVCWGFSSDNQEESLVASGEEYTNLFKETGGKSGESWKGPTYGRGSQQCIDSQAPTKGAVLLNVDNGFQHLGYCGEESLNQTKFVKKAKGELNGEGNNKGSLGICYKDCGESNSGTILGSTEVLQKERAENGKKISFYEKKKVKDS